MRIARSLCLLLCMLAHPANAQSFEDEMLKRFGDVPATLKLEERLAVLIKGSNRAGLKALLKELEAADIPALERIDTLPEGGQKALRARLDACHYAGLVIRSVVVKLADESDDLPPGAPLARALPKASADLYAERMRQCETARQLPAAKRLIGAICEHDGSCP